MNEGGTEKAEKQKSEFICLSETDISEGELRELASHLIDHTITRSEGVADWRMGIKDVVETVREKVEYRCPTIGKLATWEKLKKLVYPAYTRKELLEGNLRRMKKLIKEGKLFGVRVDQKIVAVSGIDEFSLMADGRKVFELTKASTLPEHEGKGFNGGLNVFAIQETMRKPENRGSCLTTITKDEGLKERLGRMRVFREIDLKSEKEEDKIPLQMFYDKIQDMDEVERMRKEGSKMYFFDPQAL